MPKSGSQRVLRVLQFKFTLPTADPAQFVAFIKATSPYELFGGKQVRLLQNVNHPAQFIQIVITSFTKPSRTAGSKSPATRGCRHSFRRGARCFPATSRSIFPRDR